MTLQRFRSALRTEPKKLLNRLGLRQRRKVFAVGFNKTGTTSLHVLFKSLGLPASHGPAWRTGNAAVLRAHDAFSDGIPGDIAALDAAHPGAAFILQVRDLRSWVISRLGHIARKKAAGNLPGGGPKWDVTEFAVRAWIEDRQAYHLAVLEHFRQRPDDLLVINYIREPNAAARVAGFLGFDASAQKPRFNANPRREPPARYAEMLARALADLGIPDAEADYDLYCPSLLASGEAPPLPPDTSMVDAPEASGGARPRETASGERF